jgi:glycosyltransferase involved in cell wall biosynthesis
VKTSKVKANIVHSDLNPCGGAEQVAIATIQALIEMEDIDIELTTARTPNLLRLRSAFGVETVDTIFKHIKRINPLRSLPVVGNNYSDAERSGVDAHGSCDVITINTHGDMLPYYLPHFSRTNAITYCHYPIAIELAQAQDPDYLGYLLNLDLIKMGGKASKDDDNENKNNNILLFGKQRRNFSLWQGIQATYLAMLKHSTIITNSTFSRDAILKVMCKVEDPEKAVTTTPFSSSSPGHQLNCGPVVIPPPVNVKEFRNAALYSVERDDFIVVVSRFHPSKKIENAIALATLLKKQRIGKGMIMAGGLMPEDRSYYNHILEMIKTCELSDYVRVKVNVTTDMLKSILRKGKVYFHPMPGEPFGISTAEAMSSGLVPIVPKIGGHTDFVPERYRYESLEGAADKISLALYASQNERNTISDMVISFSRMNYVKSIQQIVESVLQEVRAKSGVSTEVARSYLPKAKTAADSK